MTRVVADTNIYIWALMFGGLPGRVLALGIMQGINLVISPPLLDELQEKLLVKFEVSAEDAAAVRLKLESVADVVQADFVLDVVAEDPHDNRVLECAVAGRADYIVSGDRHLLKLKAHGGIPILTAREFLRAIEPKC
jgi:uncharacterized protein